MYLKAAGSYYVGTEQHARRAPFLILFSWNDFKARDEQRASCVDCQQLTSTRAAAILECDAAGVRTLASWQAYEWPQHCAAHRGIRSVDIAPDVYKYPNGTGKLWAAVRSVALRQCGHFMMGGARIGGTRISISGSCGADGLPCDLQDVPIAYRDRLVLVPEEVAAVYWKDDGHNTIGSSAPDVRAWALQAFKLGGR